MLIRFPRAVALSIAAVLGACSGPSGNAVPSSASAPTTNAARSVDAVLDSAPAATGAYVLIRKLSIHPDATTPATLINFVADGPAQGGVPCIDCVNGASTGDNVGMTGPSSYVLTNRYWQYALSFTDLRYKGKCKLAWAITAAKRTLDSFSSTIDIPSSAEGGFILLALNRARPKYSGPATLTGKYTCGASSSSLQVPLQFQ